MKTLSKGDNGGGVTRQMLDQITDDADANFVELQASITESQKQPYSPALTELTLSELSALVTAGTLIRGRQYYVTDEKWLLIAMDDTTLKPVSGRLLIENGDTLPTGIEPDVLLIDTGVIDTDISSNAVTIQAPADYFPTIVYHKTDSGDALSIYDMDDNLLICLNANYTSGLVVYPSSLAMPSTYSESWQFKIISGYTEGCYHQAIIEFHRSEL